jgi:F0F1-type ATP synthase membrane subunit b/b'
MAGFSRQTISVDVTSLITILWVLFSFVVFYWFYSILKRMEKTLLEIKKLLETKA